MFDWLFIAFLLYVASFFGWFDKTFDWEMLYIWNWPKTSQRIAIHLRKFHGCGWYRKSQKVGVIYSLPYRMGLNTIVPLERFRKLQIIGLEQTHHGQPVLYQGVFSWFWLSMGGQILRPNFLEKGLSKDFRPRWEV